MKPHNDYLKNFIKPRRKELNFCGFICGDIRRELL